jgi:hypothetical protein
LAQKFRIYEAKDGLEIKFGDDCLTLEEAGGFSFRYRREHVGETVAERLFSSEDGSATIAVYPSRPIMVPQELGHHIMLRLNPSISIPPESHVTHNLTMPIEIGVFAAIGSTSNYMIDTFSLTRPRYALYGLPETGHICRVHDAVPDQDEKPVPYEEAAVIMKFENNLANWVTVSRIVMDAYMVDLYTKGDTVYLEDSGMEVVDGNSAAVFLNNKPPLAGLEEVPMASENVKTYRLTLLNRTGFGVSAKFMMEHGY